MSPLLSLIQIKFCPSCNDIFLMLKIFLKYLLKIKHLGLAVYKGYHYGSVAFLKLRELIKLIKYDVGIYVLLKLYDYLYVITR